MVNGGELFSFLFFLGRFDRGNCRDNSWLMYMK